MPGKRARRGGGGLPASGQGGVALAIVVWFIAGMSLLVAGIVAQARVDTHMAQNHLARAVAVAAGDGAIRLMMADMMAANDPAQRARAEAPDGRYRIGDIETAVIVVPSSGLIDVEQASLPLLAALFEAAGGQTQEDALSLALNVVESRTAARAQGLRKPEIKLDSMEDLLGVPGFSRSLLDSVRDFIVVGEAGQGATNWSQSPAEVLAVLEKLNPAQADAVRTRSERAFEREDGAQRLTGVYRVDAIVQFGDKIWLRRRWLTTATSSSSNLPWRVLRTEPPRVLMKDDYLRDGSVDA